MPRVPSYDNLTAGATNAPAEGFSLPNVPSAAQIGAGQLQDAGAAVHRFGDTAARIALSMQEQVNQTRVNDAVNKARMAAQELAYHPQTGYLNLKGDAALTRPDGLDLTTEYGDKLREQLGQIGASLGNNEQRRQFAMNAGDLQAQFHGQVEAHMLSEFRSHALSVQDGTINLASDDAKRNWSRPDLIAPSLAAAKAAVVEKGRVSGWSAAATDAALLTTTSKVHGDVILSALESGNANYALGYLDARKGEMTADDILKVKGHVDQQVWAGQAQQAVQAATAQAQPRIVPSNFDRVVNITVHSESAGNQAAVSPKGAVGLMQVMPATGPEAAKLAGLPWDENRLRTDPAYNRALGAAYLQKQMQTYGDPAKAWAAYNAGPGRLDQALRDVKADEARGAFRGGPPPADYWLGKMPAETQAYVRKNMAALGAGGAPIARPTEAEFVDTALKALPPGLPPQVVKMTREQAVQQFALLDKSRKDTEEQTVAGAMRMLLDNGGRFSDLPPAVRAQLPPDRVDNVMSFAQKIFKGDDVTNPAVYQRLSDPTVLRGLSEAAFFTQRRELSEADFQHFARERQALLQPKNGEQPGNLDSAAIKTAVDENLRVLKIDPTPKDDGGNDAARLGALRKYVNDEVARAQALAGKKFNDTEVRAQVGRLFAQQGTISHWYGSNDAAQMLSMTPGDIPSEVSRSLKADFAKAGITSPTDAQLLGAYWTLRSRLANLPKK